MLLRPTMAHSRGAVAEVGDDDAPFGLAGVLRQDARDVFVGEAVEAVALDAFRRQRARKGKGLGDGRVAAVEGGVEAGDLADVGQQPGDDADAVEVVRLVQRRQLDELLQLLQAVAVDDHGGGKKLAAVHDAMADGGQRGSRPGVTQPAEQEVQAGLVLRFLLAGQVERDFVLAALVPGDEAGLGADAVDLAGNRRLRAQPAVQFEQANLIDDEPALMVRIPLDISGTPFGAVGVGDQRGDRARARCAFRRSRRGW